MKKRKFAIALIMSLALITALVPVTSNAATKVYLKKTSITYNWKCGISGKVVKGRDNFIVDTSNDTITKVKPSQKVVALGGLKIVSKKGIKCTYNTAKKKKYCSTYEFHTPKTKLGKIYIGRVRAYYTLTSSKKGTPKLKCTSVKKDYFWQTY